VTITVAGAAGNFELNVFKPVIAHNFLQSVRLLADGMDSFERHCVRGIVANRERIERADGTLADAGHRLAPHIGYDKAAEIAKQAHRQDSTLKEAALAPAMSRPKTTNAGSSRRDGAAAWLTGANATVGSKIAHPKFRFAGPMRTKQRLNFRKLHMS
jgi:hypothetical protein